MSSDERRPASTPHESPRWEQRLGRALHWYLLIILGSILLATGSIPIHLTPALLRLANIAVAAEFVLFLPAGYTLIVRTMKRNPATSRLERWGRLLLVTGGCGVSILLAYVFITSLLPDWPRSTAELLRLAVLGALIMLVLCGLGLVLIFVALIGEIRQLWRSRYRRPPANSGV